MAYKPYNSFAIAQTQFDGAAKILGLDEATCRRVQIDCTSRT